MSSYCQFVCTLPSDNPHVTYHNTQYGFPLQDDNALFGRLVLEINQAGLSWDTILKKQSGFYQAYAGFEIDAVAAFDDQHIAKLLTNPAIIRNRLKITATVHNALRIQKLQQEYGSWQLWLESQVGASLPAWTKTFREHFKFVGGEIVKEFLQSTGYIQGAHTPDCSVYEHVIATQPAWWRAQHRVTIPI